MITPDVEEAIQEIAEHFPNQVLAAAPDGQGGAYVVIDGIRLGLPYDQDTTWIGFHITHTCPYADVYPHFVRGDLARVDKAALGPGMSAGTVFPLGGLALPTRIEPRPAVQISRRSPRRDAGTETPLLKLLKVLKWLMSQ